ncbi:uncharacterized protein OCT59_002123 [Rhizophagus irregularis]|uniref:uncharacterized protein n=1 Tax=Rhizophagus irregularis TaxID=588596 RepID=UPI003320257E|nr:hypothetical protein OCT59_002123 [Rhizophagus irregularis]
MNENSESELIDFIIKYKLVKLIDESELSDIRPIDEGHFGIISKAMWKTTNNYVICKRLKNDKSISNKPAEAFIHELKMHGRLNFCQRIIRILGISLDKETKEYLLITEYADGGNLRQYLKNHFSELTWNDKIKLAYQITEGIKFLHGENILHQDLHSKNIVILHGDAKIISLGIAKSTESQTNLHSDVIGMIAYIDPKRLKDSFYEYNDRSDIYSLGVLMWELSSGRPPFINDINESLLRSGLLAGRREESVPDTPNEYLILYKSCWDPEPNTRPSIIQVYNRLVKLGRMRGIQDFQNIECDDDNMQGIQDDNEFNNVVTTEVNINNADIQDDNNNNVSVQEKLKKGLYGICIECKQPRSHYQWCQPCEQKQCKENFENWTSKDEKIDTFLQGAQLNSTRSQTFLEWIPFYKLENILDIKSESKTNTVYSAIWKDGPRIWNQQNEKYERIETKVIIKLNKNDDDIAQINEILNELKIYLDCHTQEYTLLVQFYGISKDPVSNDYFIVKQFHKNTSSLTDYISHNFNNLNWKMKLHLLLYLSEDLKALHNAGYVHKYYKNPSSILVFDDKFCAIETFLECKALTLLNTNEKGGWYPYKAPEILVDQPYTKASDIYSFGMIMHAIGTGKIPPYYSASHFNHFNHCLTFDICFGLRPLIPDNIPKSFKNLVEKCWNTEPDLRPNIHEVYYSLLNLWSSIYHNKYPTPLNLICLEFIAADKDYSKSNFQEMITQKAKNSNLESLEMITKEAENSNLEPLEMIKYIKKNDLVNIRNINELKIIPPIDNDQFCKISKAILKIKKTDIIVACKRFKSTQLDRTFFYELKMHKKLYSCLRILCVLGISLDENTKEYLLIMQYADGGNLRKYLKNHFLKLTWNDKLKFAYQITEGIKYLHDEDVLHQNLHSKNILIHRKEIKIILDIAKSTESDYLNEMIPYIDPKILDDRSYEYDKKSDIYSLGVLIWEISSGRPPFIYSETEKSLEIQLIISGYREKSIPNTPNEYSDLYKSCWDPEPSERPSINQVFSKLGKMLYTQIKTNLKPEELIDSIRNNYLAILIININELSNVNGNITWEKKDSSFPVICKKYKCDQLNEAFIHKLKIYRKFSFCSRIVRIFGISLDINVNEFLMIMQYANGGNLRQYLKDHFSELTWDDKIKLAYQITEGIKFLHDADIIHQNLHPKNIVIHKKEAKIMLDIVKSVETDYFNDDEMISYVDPKFLENYSYELDKKSDIYSLGVLMWELSSGYPPEAENISKNQIINGYRETRIPNIPKEYFNLYESCWHSEPNARPTINQIFNKLEAMNKNSGLELFNLIKKHKLVKFINIDELSDIRYIDGGNFGIISKAIWKKTDNYVICKRLKNNESINNKPTEAFIHELKMHGRLNFCQRIIRILGISLDEKTKEYLLIMECADGGNLHQYLNNHFSELTWNDKIKLAYQITEGIKFLQGEKILHRDLHSGNIVVHQGEAKIIDFGIAKSMETQTYSYSGVFGSLPYIDPKRLANYSYEYNEKSDIYSLGVLMWEISSGKSPFANRNIGGDLLRHDLIGGHREEPVPDTPDEYLKLYKSCWDPEPNKRPSISQVFSKLVKLGRMRGIQDFQDIKCDDDEVQGIQDNNVNDTDAQVTSTETSNNGTIDDINHDLDIPG